MTTLNQFMFKNNMTIENIYSNANQVLAIKVRNSYGRVFFVLPDLKITLLCNKTENCVKVSEPRFSRIIPDSNGLNRIIQTIVLVVDDYLVFCISKDKTVEKLYYQTEKKVDGFLIYPVISLNKLYENFDDTHIKVSGDIISIRTRLFSYYGSVIQAFAINVDSVINIAKKMNFLNTDIYRTLLDSFILCFRKFKGAYASIIKSTYAKAKIGDSESKKFLSYCNNKIDETLNLFHIMNLVQETSVIEGIVKAPERSHIKTVLSTVYSSELIRSFMENNTDQILIKDSVRLKKIYA